MQIVEKKKSAFFFFGMQVIIAHIDRRQDSIANSERLHLI